MIPKIIQLHWFFDPLPEWARLNVEEYRLLFPDWDVRVFTEIPEDLPQSLRDKIKWAPHSRVQADLVRYWLMYKYGGIYCDMDTRPKKGFDDLREHTLFLPEVKIKRSKLIDICFMGSEPGQPFWLDLLDGCLKAEKGPELKYFFHPYNTLPGFADRRDVTILQGGVEVPSWKVTRDHVRGTREVIWGDGGEYVRHYMEFLNRTFLAPIPDSSLLKEQADPQALDSCFPEKRKIALRERHRMKTRH